MNTSGTVPRDEEEDWKQCLESEGCLENAEMKRGIKCAAFFFFKGLLENSIWRLELFQFFRENVASNQGKTSHPNGTALQTLSCDWVGICTDLRMVLNLLQGVIISGIQGSLNSRCHLFQNPDIKNGALRDKELITGVNHAPPDCIPAHFVILRLLNSQVTIVTIPLCVAMVMKLFSS